MLIIAYMFDDKEQDMDKLQNSISFILLKLSEKL